MDLNYNVAPHLTEWIIGNRLLNSPFVLVDLGVRGGIHSRWWHLRDQIEVHGVDAAEEAIAPLAAARRENHRYYTAALGNEEGMTTLFVPSIAEAASLIPRELSPDQRRMMIDPGNMADARKRTVPITRLDTLMAANSVHRADFLKLDCEGMEPEILKGARHFLATGGVLGVESETSLSVIAESRQSHLSAVFEQLIPHGFQFADVAAQRIPYASFVERARALGRRRAIATTVSRPATLNALFFRELTAAPGAVSTDMILKSAIILELYGMNDVAHDLLMFFRGRFPPDFPIDEAADRLIYTVTCSRGSVRTAWREGVREVGAALRHSIRYRLGRWRRG